MLRPIVKVELAGYGYRLTCTLRAAFRLEMRLGLGLHQVGARDSAAVARTLLWALASEEHPDLTENAIGRASPVEFVAAVEEATRLLATSCFVPQQPAEGASLAARTDWLELWAIGNQDLRLSEAEFWTLTPAMFYALCKRLDAQREHAEYCAGIVAAAVSNCHIDEKTEPFEPGLWMRGAAGEEARRRRVAAQAANVSATLRHMAEVMPVKVIQGGVTTND